MKKVLVVGAGLAGMVAARSLQTHGFAVTILESSGRTGGKAGADLVGGQMWEHGYHIFPAWYRNLRALMTDLGIPLINFDRWHYVNKAGAPGKRWIVSKVPSSLTELYRSLSEGLLPMPDAILYWYFVLDMLAEPLSNKHILDQVSRLGMMRGRWYMTKHIPEMEQENVLKASAIPVYDLSAMTAKKISAYWVKAPLPFLSILEGDLQTAFVDPITAWCTGSGVTLKLNEQVTEIKGASSHVVSVKSVNTVTGATTTHVADAYLVTTPLEVTRKLLGYDLQKDDHELGNVEHLEAAPMAALTLSLNRKVPDLPREHVFFRGGKYGLSFIDLSQNWPGVPNSMLSFISSNFVPLRDFSEADQYAALMSEITEYLGVDASDVADFKLNPNTSTPLFINTVGAWPNRMKVHAKKVDNLFFAGDWVRNDIDLACMEGAVSAALHAAKEIGKRVSGISIPGPKTPPTYPEWMMRGLKWALAPAMAPIHLWSRFNAR